MIKLNLKVEDVCHACPCFEEETLVNKLYADNKIARTDITVLCKNRELCKQLKSFLKDAGEQKLPEKPYCHDCINYYVSTDKCIHCIWHPNGKPEWPSYWEPKEDKNV